MSEQPEYNGILPVNKPQGFTSFDVVAKLRGILKTRKIGHAGTLDPMAEGVLPVFLGRATKACDLLPDQDKTYTAGFRLGVVSDTQDAWGDVTETSEAQFVTKRQAEAALKAFEGPQTQLPPMYSAVKVGGKRLYDLARQGIEVERQPRKIIVYSIRLLSFFEQEQQGSIEISCSKGTYIRTICHDLGRALGCGAVMTSLTRTRAAGFSLKDCFTLEQIQQLAEQNQVQSHIFPIGRAFGTLPSVRLTHRQSCQFLNGVQLPWQELSAPDFDQTSGPLQVLEQETGAFLGIAEKTIKEEKRMLRMKKLFTLTLPD